MSQLIRQPWIGGLFILVSLIAIGILTLPSTHSAASPPNREEVIFWHFWGGRDLHVVREIVSQFNRSQSRYWVREIAMPGNNLRAKLFLSAAGGQPPDLVNIDDPVVADWFAMGLIKSVDQILEPEEARKLSQWLLPAAQKLSSSDNRLVGLCNGLDIRALYYNRTVLNDLGINEPKTLEELTQTCEKIEQHSDGTGSYQFAFLPNPQRILYFGYLFGGRFWDDVGRQPTLSDEANIAALNWMQSFARRHGPDRLAAHRQSEQSLPGKTFSLLPLRESAISGRFVFVLDGQWRTRDIAEFRLAATHTGARLPEFGVIPMPSPSGTLEQGGWANGNVFVFPKKARQSRGAIAFAKFWIGYDSPNEAAVHCQNGGWIPVSQIVIDQPTFQSYLAQEPLFAVFVRLASSPNQLPTPSVRGAGYLVRVLEETAERVAGDPRLDPEKELTKANQEVVRQLQSQRSGATKK